MLGGNWKMLASRQRDPSNPGSSGPAPPAASGDDEREARALDIKAFRWSGVFKQRSGSLSMGAAAGVTPSESCAQYQGVIQESRSRKPVHVRTLRAQGSCTLRLSETPRRRGQRLGFWSLPGDAMMFRGLQSVEPRGADLLPYRSAT